MKRPIVVLLVTLLVFAKPAFGGTCSDLLASKKTQILSMFRHFDLLASQDWLPAVPNDQWHLSEIHPQYVGEELAKSVYHSKRPRVLRFVPIHYFSREELKAAEVIIKDGKFYRVSGDLLKSVYGKEYVLLPNGQIFIMPHYWNLPKGDFRLKHSSLTNGGPVAAAGHISIDQGEVNVITRRSGHYKPSRLQLKQFVDHLKSLGVDLSETRINWD